MSPSRRASELAFPPLVIRGTQVAIEPKGISFFTREDEKPASITSREGFGADWSGLRLKEATVWGLDSIPSLSLPSGEEGREVSKVEVKDWLIDGRGITGALEATAPAESTELIDVDKFTFGFDRTWWPTELNVDGELDVGKLVGSSEKRMPCRAELRLNPFADDPSSRYALEISARRSPGTRGPRPH